MKGKQDGFFDLTGMITDLHDKYFMGFLYFT